MIEKMDKKEILKSVYDDFFGIGKIERENEKIYEDIKNLKGIDIEGMEDNIPSIEVNKQQDKKNELSKEDKDKLMEASFKKIEDLHIKDESKELLKKIIEYIRKYNEKIEKQFISFNMCIYSENEEVKKDILDILNQNINFFLYMKKGNAGIVSFYDIDKAEKLDEIYSSNHNVISFEKSKAIDLKSQEDKEKILNKLNEKIKDNEQNILTILSAKNKEELYGIFSISDDLKNEFSEFEIVEQKPDVQEVYNEILDKIKDNISLDEQTQIDLLDYVSNTYEKSDLSYVEYRDKLLKSIIFNKEIPKFEKDKSIDEVFEELDELVGLKKVKQALRDLVSLKELKNKASDDIKIKDVNLHMVFLGNPGTGKTTVARMVAEILYNLKYIKQNKLIEVSSKDLVAEYVGQTAPKTMSVVQKALGGVLFIDEAYSLASGQGQGNGYNEEAIATLIQAMENHRDNLVVIFAGYTKEMQSFLNTNSGIVSRIGYTLEFEDYTTEELIKIFEQMTSKAGFVVEKEAITKLKTIIDEYKDTKNFGNARFVRNVYEKTIIKHASNIKDKKSKKAIKTITEDDISVENLLKV
ncbi:MAG: AAA family ATPase [Clostridia bacterium]|nr:AAA family ATPase [Clostridia bacterium]